MYDERVASRLRGDDVVIEPLLLRAQHWPLAHTHARRRAAACRLAGNLKLRNPGMLAQPGAHWRAPAEGGPTVSVVVTRCPEHPEHPAARCPACDSRRGEVDHDAGVAAVREALRSAPRYEPPAVKAARAAERRGA